jgi:hypothetical protein
MSAIVQLHKDGDNMAISTNAATEQEFMGEIASLLALKIHAGDHEGDWEFQLERWLPQIVNVCCKLRGYKADVTEHRVIVAGQWFPSDMVQAFTRRKEVERELVG